MLKYKINVADALDRVGFTLYTAKKTGYISQDTLKKLRSGDTRVTLESLNRLCVILGMDLHDVIAWEMSTDDIAARNNIVSSASDNLK